MSSPNASVAIARKNPRSCTAGSATSAPSSTDPTTTIGTASRNGTPAFTSSTLPYAPRPKNPACARPIWPDHPTSTWNPSTPSEYIRIVAISPLR